MKKASITLTLVVIINLIVTAQAIKSFESTGTYTKAQLDLFAKEYGVTKSSEAKVFTPSELTNIFFNKTNVILHELKARDPEYGENAGYVKNILFSNTPSDVLVASYQDQVKSIYGEDNRVNPYAVSNLPTNIRPMYSPLLSQSKTVCGIFLKSDFKVEGSKVVLVKTCPTFQQRYGMCPTESFCQEPVLPFCTGFAIDSDIIITAGHCLDQRDPQTIYLIFGFEMTGDNQYPKEFDAQSVFTIKKVVSSKYIKYSKTGDYCVLQTNELIPTERRARYRTQGKINTGEQLYVIGHPCGLPQKLAPGGIVRPTVASQNENPEYFVTNLDTYGGNSGSPVFNASTNEVEGILVRGATDFVYSNGCYSSARYGYLDGNGEDVTRISLPLKTIHPH